MVFITRRQVLINRVVVIRFNMSFAMACLMVFDFFILSVPDSWTIKVYIVSQHNNYTLADGGFQADQLFQVEGEEML
ncbi:MAG: hypothetical protein RQ936_11410 [Gammaproteobacteria bacterium]|nr:hypothetical protein [Gammaproteobacteria bacterium]